MKVAPAASDAPAFESVPWDGTPVILKAMSAAAVSMSEPDTVTVAEPSSASVLSSADALGASLTGVTVRLTVRESVLTDAQPEAGVPQLSGSPRSATSNLKLSEPLKLAFGA